MSNAHPANSLLTPLAAFATTLAGVLALFYGQARLVLRFMGGPSAVCDTPDCALGIGVWLLVGGFVVLCASMIASTFVALRQRQPSVGTALRRGLWVGLWCLLAYVVESVAIWILV